MTTDYETPVLDGPGATDYDRYMKTDTLLSLQRDETQWVHPDELLFQTVHQSTELWLKLAHTDCARATDLISLGEFDEAVVLLTRSSRCLTTVTEQLDLMRFLSPWSFQLIRTALGHGSGFESPGWRQLRLRARELWAAFDRQRSDLGIDLVEEYTRGSTGPMLRCAEALIDLDERVSLWRTSHYKMLTRIIGYSVMGTKGRQSDTLVRLIDHRMFPELWELRTTLTAIGPMGTGMEEG